MIILLLTVCVQLEVGHTEFVSVNPWYRELNNLWYCSKHKIFLSLWNVFFLTDRHFRICLPGACYLCVSLWVLVEVSPTAKKKVEQESEKDTGKKEDKGEDPQVPGEIDTSFTHCFSPQDVKGTCQYTQITENKSLDLQDKKGTHKTMLNVMCIFYPS